MEESTCTHCEEPILEQSPGCALHCMQPSCKAYTRKPTYDFNSKPMIWINGGPGLDRQGIASKVAAKYGLDHISIGNLLIEDIRKNKVTAACLVSVMERGEFVPNDVVLALLKTAIEKNFTKSKGFIISGYPREKSQGYMFEKKIAPVSMFFYLEAKAEALANMLRSRPKLICPIQNKEDTIRAKIKIFFENNAKVIEQYPHRLVKINAERNADAIVGDISKVLDGLLGQNKSAYQAGSPLM